MNEKIKELADNAGISWCIQTEFDIRNMDAFVELIIQECIRQIHATTSESIDLIRNLDENASWIENDIKKHFGVE